MRQLSLFFALAFAATGCDEPDPPCPDGWELSKHSNDRQCIPLEVGAACDRYHACPDALVCAYPTTGEQGLCLATCASVDGDCEALGDGQHGQWSCEPMIDGPKVCFYIEHDETQTQER